MKRDRLLIRGSQDNRIEIEHQSFKDAIITAYYTKFRYCGFQNCNIHLKDHCKIEGYTFSSSKIIDTGIGTQIIP